MTSASANSGSFSCSKALLFLLPRTVMTFARSVPRWNFPLFVRAPQGFCRRSVRAGSTCTDRCVSSRWSAEKRNWTKASATRQRSAVVCWSASRPPSWRETLPPSPRSSESRCNAAPMWSVGGVYTGVERTRRTRNLALFNFHTLVQMQTSDKMLTDSCKLLTEKLLNAQN